MEGQPLTFPEAMYQTGIAFVDTCRVINWSVTGPYLPVYSFVLEKVADRFSSPTPRAIIENWRRLMGFQMPMAMYENFSFVCCEAISKSLDSDGRLHSQSGPAIEYLDGFKMYCWHGTTVPGWVVTQPEWINVTRIEKEANAEVRRVLVERYGEEKFINDSQAVPVQEDESGVLYRREFLDDEPLVMVRVKNSTPEPDGSFKHYFLRVPPEIETARQAVAWTFGMNGAEYAPEVES